MGFHWASFILKLRLFLLLLRVESEPLLQIAAGLSRSKSKPTTKMITLKSEVASAPMVYAFKIETLDCSAVITVDVERDDKGQPKPIRERKGEEWVEDPTRVRQLIQWPGGSLEGICFEKDAIATGGRVGRVIVEVETEEIQLPAFEAGRKSKTASTIRLRRVLEVWATPEKSLFKAKA